MTDVAQNNKRIAKNTLLLYIRMLVIMGISFFTVRIILEKLGIVDYGIYNVVGSIVVMFSFLKTSLTSASQRYFAYSIGKDVTTDKLSKLFKTNILFYLIVCAIIIVFAETIGLWFLNNKLIIPDERLFAANCTYQMSVLAFVISTMMVPYESIITAHENMDIYAYLSIIESILKLVIVYFLSISSFDKLIIYSLLVTISTFIVFLLYGSYCKYKYRECKLGIYYNKGLFQEIANYTTWNIVGTLASVFNTQGSDVILNIFFGPAVNGARAIANQIIGIATRFSSNFFTAVRPRLIKLYAENAFDEMFLLVTRSARFTYFLIFLISIPILFQLDFVLKIWLGNIPEYVETFAKLSVISILIDALSNPLVTVAQATGKIKKYQIVLSAILLTGIPISYILLKFINNENIVFYILILISISSLVARLLLLKQMVGFSIRLFFKTVIIRVFLVSIIVLILSYCILNIHYNIQNDWIKFIINSLIIIIIELSTIFLIGITPNERLYLLNFFKSKIFKKHV